MRILVDDGLQQSVGTGIGNYARYLAGALAELPQTEVETENFAPRGSRRRARLSYLLYLASRGYYRKLRNFDVVHYANYAMPRRTPRGTLTAVTVHDLTAFLHPDTLPSGYARYNRFMIRRAVKHADLLFTVSESVRAELIARFPEAEGKTVAVPPGHYHRTTDAPVAEAYESPALSGLQKGKFFLFVGTVEKRKNLGVLLRAYRRLQSRCPATREYALVLAGREGFGAEDYRKIAETEPVLGDIRFPGYVSSADCVKLYREAAAFVFPSLYEGFGSPQTECMDCRLPLILSDIPTNREVSSGYGWYFPAEDDGALALHMEAIVLGRWDAAQADSLAKERLARFRWQDAADATLGAYKEAFKNR